MLGRALLQNAAVLHKDDAVGHLARKAHLMRHADHGDVLLRELDHDVQNFLDHLGVECRGRLVKQDDGLLGAQGTGDGDALLLTAREILRILAGLMRHADTLERGDSDLGRLLLALLL